MTDSRPVITAYCLDWHITTSSAFMELLVKPLALYADIRLVAWDGQQDLPAPKPDEITLFCQLAPPQHWLATYSAPVVWIPMADSILYPANLKNHPAVRVVAFSTPIQQLAQDLGLPYLRMRYFLNPDLFTPASFDAERVLLYWNRTGFFYKAFLLQLCAMLRVNRLIFRDILDPRIPKRKHYTLPTQVGEMLVEAHHTLTTHDEYLSLLNRANIFIAPRKLEGVGITFLEAMARGCCVIAYDHPTMNEYIRHGENGLLFGAGNPRTGWAGRITNLLYRAFNKLSWQFRHRPIPRPALTMRQNWDEIRRADVVQLGANARQSMREGYAQWINSLPQYAQFVLSTIAPD